MHTQSAETEHRVDGEQGVGAAARMVAEHASALARLELELAALELKRKVAALGIGIAFAVVAAILALYMLGFAFAGAAAGIASFTPTWAALLIVAAGLLVVVAVLAFLAVQAMRRGTPPVPEQAIEEAKITERALKGDGRP
jgi:Putative Actinobacterial Holin-X, holin superfamily III